MQVLSSLSGIPFYAPSAGFSPTNSADVSAIASAYAESAASSKLDSTASSSFYPSDNPSGFISGVDLSDYATTAYVDSSVSSKLDTTAQVVTSIGVAAGALSSINGYGLSAGLANSAGTATVWLGASSKLDASAASDFALTAQLEDYLEKTASSQFLTAVPDGYATEQYVDSSISGFAYESAVSGWTAKQDTLTYGYNAANQISSIDGSALGGMDEAAVSGIASAYAESAVSSVSGNYYTTANESGFLTAQAQASWSESASASPSYIQDKPDLVDIVAGPGIVVDNPDGNTLRVSMAADYETVLWSGSSTGSTPGFYLNEPYTNFEYIRIDAVEDFGFVGSVTLKTQNITTANRFSVPIYSVGSFTKGVGIRSIYFHPTSDVYFDSQCGGFDFVNSYSVNDKTHVKHIVGINRTASAQ